MADEMVCGRSALLLSGEVGAGHRVTAEMLTELLGRAGWRTETVDSMGMLGSRGAAAGEALFRRMLSAQGLYDAFHFAALRPGNALACRADRAARRRMVPALTELVDTRRPDVVIAVFATGASAAAELARTGDGPPVIAFCTDVTPHRLWVHEGVGSYLVICRAAAEAVRRFAPRAHVVVVPRPVRAEFLAAPGRDVARQKLGLRADERCVLLMGGGWGLGPVAETAAALAEAGLQVLAVAGSNATLRDRLVRLASSRPGLRAYGFTDEIPTLMSAADLVITTSGVTCSEARAIGRPMLLLDVVPGHGRENLQYELELGGAGVVGTDPRLLTESVLAALDRGENIEPQDPSADFAAGLARALAQVGLA